MEESLLQGSLLKRSRSRQIDDGALLIVVETAPKGDGRGKNRKSKNGSHD